METIRKTENFTFIKDTIMGVTRFIRRRDNAVTMWNTGYEAEVEIASVAKMNDAVFDEYCEDNDYSDGDKTTPSDEDYIAAARSKYHRDGEIEIDDEPKVSRGDDPGAYVQAWVWVYDSDVEKAACK